MIWKKKKELLLKKNNGFILPENLAKRADKLKNPVADSVYVNASEDIIQSVIKYYINYEKYFILFNDIINNLIQKFHI